MPAAVKRIDGSWRLTLCRKEGVVEIGAKMVLNCTGDANVVRLAGYAAERNENAQPGPLTSRCQAMARVENDWRDRAGDPGHLSHETNDHKTKVRPRERGEAGRSPRHSRERWCFSHG